MSAIPVGLQVQASSTDDALRAKRAQLVAQLQQLTGPRAGASAQLLAAEQALSTIQTQLGAARAGLTNANAQLLRLSQQIQDDEHTVSTARVELAQLVRATYITSSGDGFLTAILSADTFNQAMDRVKGAAHVTDEVRQLEVRLQDRQVALAAERKALQKDSADALALEAQLASQDGQLLALVAQRDAAFRSLDGPARAIAAQIADIDQQLAGNSQPARVSSSSSCGNHFAYGYCTYYVATRRCIPWFGDAWQWWGAAASYGYAEGHTPQVGAVAVWGRYGSSPDGHVAYVEAVGPSSGVPAGSFLVSEMNYSGWNRVDRRVVSDNAAGLVGFIYGKA
ncbi:MAG TPA: CHAP domain-containing protein [Candidatus Dormibacteraeota bacterium]|nr:CHAP domain-containing protein [Candidatus Dormibacteraeota bacterium]